MNPTKRTKLTKVPMPAALALAVFFIMTAALCPPAFAIWADRTPATGRQDETLTLVRIHGILSCDMGSENTGEGCVLKIKDNRSGRVFRVIEANSQAMRLFQSGNKSVILEGEATDGDSIRINKIENSLARTP